MPGDKVESSGYKINFGLGGGKGPQIKEKLRQMAKSVGVAFWTVAGLLGIQKKSATSGTSDVSANVKLDKIVKGNLKSGIRFDVNAVVQRMNMGRKSPKLATAPKIQEEADPVAKDLGKPHLLPVKKPDNEDWTPPTRVLAGQHRAKPPASAKLDTTELDKLVARESENALAEMDDIINEMEEDDLPPLPEPENSEEVDDLPPLPEPEDSEEVDDLPPLPEPEDTEEVDDLPPLPEPEDDTEEVGDETMADMDQLLKDLGGDIEPVKAERASDKTMADVDQLLKDLGDDTNKKKSV